MRFWRGLIQRREVRICLLCAMVALPIGAGCDSASPFLLSTFNGKLPAGGVAGDAVDGNDDDDGVGPNGRARYEHVDQLPAELRTFNFGEGNSSVYPLQWRALFVVTAGEGGFVRNEADILDYMSAGYEDLLPPDSEVGATVQIGCVTLRLDRGTRLMAMTSGDFLGADVIIPGNNTGDPDALFGFGFEIRNDNRDPNIPVPERVVFTTRDPRFECDSPIDPCSQQAVNFYDQATMTQEVGKPVTASRIQGTLCNLGISRAPECRLDVTNDGMTLPYEFVPGGIVIYRVLARAFDGPETNRRQVVWTVFDSDENIVHAEQP